MFFEGFQTTMRMTSMPNSDLNHAIQALKKKALPAAPPIEARVLRAIRNAEVNHSSLSFDWLEALLQPRFAAACLALALACSTGITALTSSAQQSAAAYPKVAAQALSFDTFQATDLLAFSTPSQK